MRFKRFLYNYWYYSIALVLIILVLLAPENKNNNDKVVYCTSHEYKNRINVYIEGETVVKGKMSFYDDATILNLINASGISDYSDITNLKLDEKLKDGQTYLINNKGEKNVTVSNKSTRPNSFESIKKIKNKDDALININEANLTMLKTLPNIGEVRGKAIIEYREKNGPFKRCDELKNINGITDDIYNEISNYITC